MADSTNTAFRRPRPLYLLTTDLCSTYKRINQRYYAQQKRRRRSLSRLRAAKSSPSTPTNYDYDVKAGEVLADRFVLGGILGKGSFGQVVRAFDRSRSCYVAIKIIKGQRAFFEQAASEMRILRHIERHEPPGSSHIVRMLDSFVHQNHQCLVFETLSLNLYELLRETQFKGVSLHLVRNLARQLLEALGFLHAQHIIHCDLKPENILLCNARRSKVKIIDLGSSCFDNEQLYTYLQSRFYRAPEILLGLDYGTQIE